MQQYWLINNSSQLNMFWGSYFAHPQEHWTVLQLVVKCTHDVARHRPATSCVHYTTSCNTQSSAPEDGQNNCSKHVELIGIINKPLSLHLVGCLYYLYQ